MELAGIAAEKIFQMFVMLLVGFICSKVHLINRETNKRLSDISLMLISPFIIFMSYQVDYDATLVRNLLISFALALLMFVMQTVLSYVLIRRKGNDNFGVEAMSTIYSNCGFIGIPLAYGLFGSEGVLYTTAFVSVFNIFVWTQGVIMMTGKSSAKELVRNLCTPCIFAVILGIFCFLTRIRLPEIVAEPMQSIADMNTPFAMLVAGSKLGETDFAAALKRTRSYYICLVKLVLIPIACTIVLRFFDLPEVVLLTQVALIACPTGATGTMFAVRYQKNSVYASEIFAISTLFSIITIPCVVVFAGLIGVGA